VNWDGRRAQTTVEFALVLPLLLLILAGTIQFGQIFFTYAQLLQAAQEGARAGAVLHLTDAAITNRVQQVSPGGLTDTVQINATVSPNNNTPVAAIDRQRGNVLTVTVRHPQPIWMPFVPLSAFTLTAMTSMMVE
jgi:Flp pilus assembly protein TadG